MQNMDSLKNRCINEDFLDLYTLCYLLNKDYREYKNIREFRHKIIEEIKDDSSRLKFESEIFSFCGAINQRHFFSQLYKEEIGNNSDKISISLSCHGINIPNILFSDINCSCPLFKLKDEDEFIFNNFTPVVIIPEFSSFLYYQFLEYLVFYENKSEDMSLLHREILFREWLTGINLNNIKSHYSMYTYNIEKMESVKKYKFSMLSEYISSDLNIKPWLPKLDQISKKDIYQSIKKSILLAEENLNE